MIEAIFNLCCDEFGTNGEDVISNSRIRELVDCRKAFSLLAHEFMHVKNEVISNIIHKNESNVRYYILSQPSEKYYQFHIKNLRKKIAEL